VIRYGEERSREKQMRNRSRSGASAGVVAAALVVGGVLCAPWASAADELPTPENGGSLVEDGSYPGADAIFAETGIRLVRGDGRIMMADCAGDRTGLIVVQRRGGDDVCFRATGTSGYLALELPLVYLVRSDATHDLRVTVTVDGETQQAGGDPAEWFGVGEGASETSGPATLLELRTSA
jgi:hypothetical protein